MMTPAEVRRASLWTLAGLVAVVILAPLLPASMRLPALVLDGLGYAIAAWTLTRINIGAPGWRVGTPGEFDERETAERYRALATSYIIVVLVVSGMLASGGLLRLLGVEMPAMSPPPRNWAFLAIIGLPALPGIILAWRDHTRNDLEIGAE